MPFGYWIDIIGMCTAVLWPTIGIFILVRQQVERVLSFLYTNDNIISNSITSIIISLVSGILICCILAIIMSAIVGG